MTREHSQFSTLVAGVRQELCINDELPCDSLECVYVPTFHEVFAIRLVGVELEVWSAHELDSVPLLESLTKTLYAGLRRVLACPTPFPAELGRDGIVISTRLAGSPCSELIRCTAESATLDPLLVFSSQLLAVALEYLPTKSPNQRICTEAQAYFDG